MFMTIARILAAARGTTPAPDTESARQSKHLRAAQDEAREWKRRALMSEFRIEEAHKDRDFWRAEARANDNAGAIRSQALRSLLDGAEREVVALRIDRDYWRRAALRAGAEVAA